MGHWQAANICGGVEYCFGPVRLTWDLDREGGSCPDPGYSGFWEIGGIKIESENAERVKAHGAAEQDRG